MTNCKQSYFNSKASSVNLRFSKSASLQFFSHDAKTMQRWNIGIILCDRSLRIYPLQLELGLRLCLWYVYYGWIVFVWLCCYRRCCDVALLVWL